MNHHRRPYVVGVILALCVALLACGLSALLGARSSSPVTRAQQFSEARNRWLSQVMTHYRLVMQAPSWCQMDVEIQAEKVVHVFENTCPTAPRTVSGLFDLIKQLDNMAGMTFCAPRGCECTEMRYIQATYDEQLGFPRTIRLRRERQANWPELWRFMIVHGLPNCLTPLDVDLVRVVSIKPIS